MKRAHAVLIFGVLVGALLAGPVGAGVALGSLLALRSERSWLCRLPIAAAGGLLGLAAIDTVRDLPQVVFFDFAESRPVASIAGTIAGVLVATVTLHAIAVEMTVKPPESADAER